MYPLDVPLGTVIAYSEHGHPPLPEDLLHEYHVGKKKRTLPQFMSFNALGTERQ